MNKEQLFYILLGVVMLAGLYFIVIPISEQSIKDHNELYQFCRDNNYTSLAFNAHVFKIVNDKEYVICKKSFEGVINGKHIINNTIDLVYRKDVNKNE